MSSYFDSQYGGEDPDDIFKEGDSDDDESTSTTLDDLEDEQEIGQPDEFTSLQDDNDDDVEESEEEDEISDDEDNQEGGDPDSELEEEEIDKDNEQIEKKAKKIKKVPAKNVYKQPVDFIDNDDDDDDDDGEQYLQKFDQSVNDNYILNFHPESVLQNYDEILSMTKVVRNTDGIIVDNLHRTIPYLTKYEKARILGQRAKQINSGTYPFVKVPENVIDGYIIAELELKEKRIPFIIRRPLPNGGSEYWKVQDLEDISF